MSTYSDNAVAISEEQKQEAIKKIIDRIIDKEIFCNASSLVSTVQRLARSSEADEGEFDQACELDFAPVSEDDAEEAAQAEGWSNVEESSSVDYTFAVYEGDKVLDESYAGDWKDLCSEQSINVYQQKVLEHWAVSSWLGDKLEELDECVDSDFCGMVVWGRTCSGQHIGCDYVIQRIAENLYNH